MSKNETQVVISADTKALDNAIKRSEQSFNKFGRTLKRVAVAVAAAFTVGKLAQFVRAAVQAASDLEQAQFRLEGQLRATGERAGFTSEQLDQLAKNMESMSRFSRTAAKEAQIVALRFQNIKGDTFREVTELAADMAVVMGKTLPQATQELASMLDDPRRAIAALDSAGATLTMQQEILVRQLYAVGRGAEAQQLILQKLRETYGGAAARDLDTWEGRWAKVKNRFGSIVAQIGQALIPILEKLMPFVEATASVFQRLADVVTNDIAPRVTAAWEAVLSEIEPFIETIKEIIAAWTLWHGTQLSIIKDLWIAAWGKIRDYVKPTLEFIRDLIIVGFTTIEFTIKNWEKVARYALESFAYAAVKSFNVVVHFLTRTIPEALSWFLDNWKDIFKTAWNFIKTVFNNIVKNAKEAWDAMQRIFRGEGFSFNWTPLTEGFKNEIKKLPEFSKRIPTELERALGNDLDRLGSELGESFGDLLAKNMEKVKQTAEDIGNIIDDNEKDNAKPRVDLTPHPKGPFGFKPEGGMFAQSAGSFVGLEDLNKKIQGAAAKNPMLDVMKQLHKVQIGNHQEAQHKREQVIQGINGVKKAIDKTAETLAKNRQGSTSAVYAA